MCWCWAGFISGAAIVFWYVTKVATVLGFSSGILQIPAASSQQLAASSSAAQQLNASPIIVRHFTKLFTLGPGLSHLPLCIQQRGNLAHFQTPAESPHLAVHPYTHTEQHRRLKHRYSFGFWARTSFWRRVLCTSSARVYLFLSFLLFVASVRFHLLDLGFKGCKWLSTLLRNIGQQRQ